MHTFFSMLPDLDQENGLSFTTVVCAYCGQVRRVWSDGRIEIIKEYGSIKNLTSNSDHSRI